MVELFALGFAVWAISLVYLTALRDKRRSVRLAVNVLWLMLLIPLLVLVGMRFGWRAPVTMIAVDALFVLRMTTQPRDPGRLRTTVEFFVFALIGMALGIFVFGGAGGIFGFTMGVVARLAEIPPRGIFRSPKPPDADGPRAS
jgi:hypothetical protein